MDLLMTRYSNIEYINELPIDDGLDLILMAYEKRDEDKAYQLYTARYATMDKESYMAFDKFYNPKRQAASSDKAVEDILVDVKETLDIFRGKEVEQL